MSDESEAARIDAQEAEAEREEACAVEGARLQVEIERMAAEVADIEDKTKKTEEEARQYREMRCRFDESDVGGVVGADGSVYSDADPGL